MNSVAVAIGVLLALTGLAQAGESTRVLQYMFDGDKPIKKRILVTAFGTGATATVSIHDGQKQSKRTFPIKWESFDRFWRGFQEMGLLKNSLLDKEAADTETHHIFLVVEKTDGTSKDACYAVPIAKADAAFRKWLATIEQEETTGATPEPTPPPGVAP